jgi:hypothetical protein
MRLVRVLNALGHNTHALLLVVTSPSSCSVLVHVTISATTAGTAPFKSDAMFVLWAAAASWCAAGSTCHAVNTAGSSEATVVVL